MAAQPPKDIPPTGTMVHCVAPTAALPTHPVGQFLHVSVDAPVSGEYVPPAHFVQPSSDINPVFFEYFPEEHLSSHPYTGPTREENSPAEQFVQ